VLLDAETQQLLKHSQALLLQLGGWSILGQVIAVN
jgi:hypothetical protein